MSFQVIGKTILAPMAGVTDSSFRIICKEHGAAVVFSEMVSADGLVRNDSKSFQYLKFTEIERPIAIQIFSANPAIIAEAAQIVESKSPDFIDLNFGCPVKKVIKKGAGAALLKDLPLLGKIASRVASATSIPVTAKIRSGWSGSDINAIEVARILEDCGIAMITVHPRTQTQYFKYRSNWDIIRQVKQAVTIPVIGNGDITNPMDAKKMTDTTGCDYVMIGRAVMGFPWIFDQINTYLNRGFYEDVTAEQRRSVIFQHLDLVVSQKGEYRAVREMRKHIAWYLKGLPNSASMRTELFKINRINQIREKLTKYFDCIVKEEHDYIVSEID